MAQPDERSVDIDAGVHETVLVHTDYNLELHQAAIELAERDADHGYDQTYHAGKLALGFLTALGLICTTGAPFIVTFIRAPHTWGWIFGAVFVALAAATLISGILTFRSSMPPRHKITEEHTGWVATLAVAPEQLSQYYLDRAKRRLASSSAEAQRLASIAHAKHRGNYRTGGLLISAVFAGLAMTLALRLGW